MIVLVSINYKKQKKQDIERLRTLCSFESVKKRKKMNENNKY